MSLLDFAFPKATITINHSYGYIIMERNIKAALKKAGIDLLSLSSYLERANIKRPVVLSSLKRPPSSSSFYFTAENSTKKIIVRIDHEHVSIEEEKILKTYYRKQKDLEKLEFHYPNGTARLKVNYTILSEDNFLEIELMEKGVGSLLLKDEPLYIFDPPDIDKAEKILSSFLSKPFSIKKAEKKLFKNLKLIKIKEF